MANTYQLISSNTVGSGGVASVTFSSIPGTYTDLLLKVNARSIAAVTNADVNCYFNGDSTSFSWKVLQGNGSVASSAGASSTSGRLGIMPAATATSSTFSNIETYIPNYAGANNKSFSSDSVMENNATLSYNELGANLWSDTSAINSIEIVSGNGNFVQYSSFYLYGIKNS
jgi:hypothetical protein